MEGNDDEGIGLVFVGTGAGGGGEETGSLLLRRRRRGDGGKLAAAMARIWFRYWIPCSDLMWAAFVVISFHSGSVTDDASCSQFGMLALSRHPREI